MSFHLFISENTNKGDEGEGVGEKECSDEIEGAKSFSREHEGEGKDTIEDFVFIPVSSLSLLSNLGLMFIMSISYYEFSF